MSAYEPCQECRQRSDHRIRYKLAMLCEHCYDSAVTKDRMEYLEAEEARIAFWHARESIVDFQNVRAELIRRYS